MSGQMRQQQTPQMPTWMNASGTDLIGAIIFFVTLFLVVIHGLPIVLTLLKSLPRSFSIKNL